MDFIIIWPFSPITHRCSYHSFPNPNCAVTLLTAEWRQDTWKKARGASTLTGGLLPVGPGATHWVPSRTRCTHSPAWLPPVLRENPLEKTLLPSSLSHPAYIFQWRRPWFPPGKDSSHHPRPLLWPLLGAEPSLLPQPPPWPTEGSCSRAGLGCGEGVCNPGPGSQYLLRVQMTQVTKTKSKHL